MTTIMPVSYPEHATDQQAGLWLDHHHNSPSAL
jgi:hypothetical protein